MALGTQFHMDFFHGGTNDHLIPAGAHNFGFWEIGWMKIRFHNVAKRLAEDRRNSKAIVWAMDRAHP